MGDQRCIIILGMHRSGTSCLAGMLEQFGIYFGKYSSENKYNKKGNKENLKIQTLHEFLLYFNNGTWFSPPKRIYWHNAINKVRNDIINDFKGHDLWGFKDPRVLLVLEGWLKVINNFSLVGTFRHPELVARSLNTRDGLSISEGLNLWKIYNSKLINYYDKYKFPIISFDNDEEIYNKSVLSVSRELMLPNKPEGIDFYDKSLKNNVQLKNINISSDIRYIYDRLLIISKEYI